MIHLENKHFSFNRILLVTVGLWPYEQSKYSRFRFFLFSSILIAATIFQVKQRFINIICNIHTYTQINVTLIILISCKSIYHNLYYIIKYINIVFSPYYIYIAYITFILHLYYIYLYIILLHIIII